MKILFVGDTRFRANSAAFARALSALGHDVVCFDPFAIRRATLISRLCHRIRFHMGLKLGLKRINQNLIEFSRTAEPNLVWVHKGVDISRSALLEIQTSMGIPLVHVNPDDPFGKYSKGWESFVAAIPMYDVHFVSRRENVSDYKAQGARAVFEYDRAFDPDVHRPVVGANCTSLMSASIGFIGTWARERARSLSVLVKKGIDLSIRGNDWRFSKYWSTLRPAYDGGAVYGDDYARALGELDIALHYLRQENRDRETDRTYEIPACGAFMLAERSDRHMELFEEGEEAEFFGSDEELIDKIRYYSTRPRLRKKIAQAGLERCYESGYRYTDRTQTMLEQVQTRLGLGSS